jgi:hypothetical protein
MFPFRSYSKSLVVPVLVWGLAGCTAYAETAPDRSLREITATTSVLRPAPGQISSTAGQAAPVTRDQSQASRGRGATWLVKSQKDDGGWGAGAWGTDNPQAPSDVATTSLVILALHRDAAGDGRHKKAIMRGINYVTQVIEQSPEGPRLNVPEGTQPQHKLGNLVDTHFAALMLGEMAGTQNDKTNKTIQQALKNVVQRVQKAQQSDGSFDSNGWAPVLSSSVAASSLYRAQELGIDIKEEILDKNDRYQRSMVKGSSAGGVIELDSSAGAGVDLYAAATTLRGNFEAKKRVGAAPADQEASKDAEEAAYSRIAGQGSEQLFAGFGSVGGEEMLSYMMISDTLADEGGTKFEDWDKKVSSYLVQIQNNDGSWAGHHCITSRTFVTAAAMMSLGAPEAATMRAERAAKSSKKSTSGKHASTQGAFGSNSGTVD